MIVDRVQDILHGEDAVVLMEVRACVLAGIVERLGGYARNVPCMGQDMCMLGRLVEETCIEGTARSTEYVHGEDELENSDWLV